ncbi:hypothetical protein BJ170DRAFT_598694 [Xylariales sp. AK1849]|nr:hypothetical protein BJ170DRAFT_598694 [Xylariales sp. AK1849]
MGSRNALSSSPGPLSAPQDRRGQPDNELPDLKDFLNSDLRPTFIVPINESAPVPFELLLCNDAFSDGAFEGEVLRRDTSTIRFQSWCQTVVHWTEEYEYAGTTWTAFKIRDRWKCIRTTGLAVAHEPGSEWGSPGRASRVEDNIRNAEDVKIADARVASLYRMMEMSDVGTFEYSPQGRLLRANESWYRLSLHPRVEAAHADFSFMDLVYPPDGPLVLSQWNQLAKGNPVTFEMRWKGRDYRGFEGGDGIEDAQWVLSACVPIQDEHGNLVSIAGNTVDINAHKKSQEEALQRAEALERARASELKFARFALLAPVAIFILDPNGKMTYCNNRFFELTCHPPADDNWDIDWQRIVYADDGAIVEELWRTILHDKQRTQAHFRLTHTWDLGDDTLRQAWAETQAIPELDDQGNVVSIFGTMTNISRFKWAEEMQRTRMEEALEAKRKHENFIDMTSHEMRNPLSAVVQCADSTMDSLKTVRALIFKSMPSDAGLIKRIDDEINLCLDSLGTIISCSLHQKRVVDDILTLSKMDSNLMAITPVRVEPATIVSEAVHMFELECIKDGIDLSFIEDSSLRDLAAQYVMMDPSRVLQVLINLITNAIKFTRDRPTRRIQVSLGACTARPSQDSEGISYANVTADVDGLLGNGEWGLGREVYICIKCQDTGCGLTMEEQGNLFTRFSQATPRTHIRYGGSGLGLFISKKLTELQGGAIGVQSEPDVGSTFAFFVATRIAPPPTPVRIEAVREFPLSRAVSIERNVQEKPQISVLIVEDNLVNQKVLSQQLRKAGCEVYVSNHGVEALDFLRTTQHWATNGLAATPISLSVILMDIEMPVMDGLTCTRKIRQYQKTGEIVGHIPIMAVSANARSEQVTQAREAGMDDAISKPFRIPELMPKLEALVNGEGPAIVVTPSA